MLNIAEELAIQSWCFRGFKKNEQAVEKVKQCGLAKIELSNAHVDFSDDASFDEIINLYAQNGIAIISIGMVRFRNDEPAERKFFDFVKTAGAKFITVDFAVDSVPASYRTAEKLADEYDVRLAIHNHGGRHWLGSKQMIAHVLANTSERIGLCLDTAWAQQAGEDPIAMAEKFADRLYGLHIKDFVFDAAGKWRDAIVGTGNLDLTKLNATLKQIDFNGFAVLEYEGDVANPVPALKDCIAAIKQQMQG